MLKILASDELAELAEDFVQDTFVKLTRDEYALLDQFREPGRFLSWVAQITCREAGQELRKSYWIKQEPLSEREHSELEQGEWPPTISFTELSETLGWESEVISPRVKGILETCLAQLPERRRLAFWAYGVEEHSTRFIAESLNSTENAVYILIHRAKRALKKCLQEAGVDQTIFEVLS